MMKYDSDGTTIVVRQEDRSLDEFVRGMEEGYHQLENEHLIVVLSLSELTLEDSNLISAGLQKFEEISNRHREAGKSFVLVTDKISYNDVPEVIVLAPTLQEAHDIIQMEEIERDLDL